MHCCLINFCALLLTCATLSAGLVNPMTQARRLHTATLLENGKVLVVGGIFGAPGTAVGSCELFDPATGSWSAALPLNSPRWGHTANLLPEGRILVVGGFDGNSPVASSELYIPEHNLWSPYPLAVLGRGNHQTALLGGVWPFVTGGAAAGNSVLGGSAMFDPGSVSWMESLGMSQARNYHAATLPHGRSAFG